MDLIENIFQFIMYYLGKILHFSVDNPFVVVLGLIIMVLSAFYILFYLLLKK